VPSFAARTDPILQRVAGMPPARRGHFLRETEPARDKLSHSILAYNDQVVVESSLVERNFADEGKRTGFRPGHDAALSRGERA